MEDTLMSMKVECIDGDYTVSVKAEQGSTNSWSLGKDEAIAKGRVSTIMNSYLQGLEFIQEQVREAFAEAEDTTE